MGFDESELSESERIGIAILVADALAWRMAIDLGYVHPETWELQPHRYRIKTNGDLSGGFPGQFRPNDLVELRAFWLGPEPNWCLPRGYDGFDWRDWRRRIMAMDVVRSRSRIPPRRELDLPRGRVWASGWALSRIRGHPEAKACAVSVYMALCEMRAESEGPAFSTTIRDLARRAGVSRNPADQSLRILRELQLVRTSRERYGFSVVLLHSR